MSDDVYREHKLVEAIPDTLRQAATPNLNAMPDQPHPQVTEQQREAAENEQAHHAQGHLRDRLVEIGKAHHMGGRGTGRVSDS